MSIIPHCPAVFFDRDGVLNPPVISGGVTRAPKNLSEFVLFPDVSDALRKLSNAGFVLIVITNQQGVAEGAEWPDDVEEIHAYLCKTLPIRDVLACYHDASAHCRCRKPEPGMFLEAAKRLHLDLARSFAVGDHWVDTAAAKAARCGTTLLVRQNNTEQQERCAADQCVANLADCANWILRTAAKSPT